MFQMQQKTLYPSKLFKKARQQRRTRKCFEDSVDVEKSVKVDYNANPQWKRRYLCWEAKGQLADAFRDLGPRILVELNQSRRESSREVAITLFMVGKTAKDAKPIIIISSEDRESREEARNAIERSNILIESDFKLGLLRYPPSGQIKPVAMEDKSDSQLPSSGSFGDVYVDPSERFRLIGMPIYIKQGANLVRKATANAVYNGKDYGFITAAHAFRKNSRGILPIDDEGDLGIPFDSDSETASDDSDDTMELLSQYSNTSPEATESEFSPLSSSETSQPQMIGLPAYQSILPSVREHIPTRAESTVEPPVPSIASDRQHQALGKISAMITPLDCGVITVTHAGINTLLTAPGSSATRIDPIKVAKPRRTKVIAWTSHGPIHGNLIDVPIFMRLPNSGSHELVYKFTYDGDIRMGDCGTFITDAETRELYGFVIAKSENVHLAYMMAAEQVSSDIKRSGNWQLLSLETAESMDKRRTSLYPGPVQGETKLYGTQHQEDQKVAHQESTFATTSIRHLAPQNDVRFSSERSMGRRLFDPEASNKRIKMSGSSSGLASMKMDDMAARPPQVAAQQIPRGLKRSRSPVNIHGSILQQEHFTKEEESRRTSGRPPKSQPLTPMMKALPTPPKSQALTTTIKALPTVRDHTTDQLTPDSDEYVPREFDEAGEQKITETGHLLNGREYRCRTFLVPNRGNKLFMLATECARVLGYRDSFLLFNKNRSLYKIIATQAEKDDLIHQEILPYSYRSRQISIVTARSMFRQFGSRIIVDGRRVRDDYWESKARKQGFTEDDAAGEKRPGKAKAREKAAAEASEASATKFPIQPPFTGGFHHPLGGRYNPIPLMGGKPLMAGIGPDSRHHIVAAQSTATDLRPRGYVQRPGTQHGIYGSSAQTADTKSTTMGVRPDQAAQSARQWEQPSYGSRPDDYTGGATTNFMHQHAPHMSSSPTYTSPTEPWHTSNTLPVAISSTQQYVPQHFWQPQHPSFFHAPPSQRLQSGTASHSMELQQLKAEGSMSASGDMPQSPPPREQ